MLSNWHPMFLRPSKLSRCTVMPHEAKVPTTTVSVCCWQPRSSPVSQSCSPGAKGREKTSTISQTNGLQTAPFCLGTAEVPKPLCSPGRRFSLQLNYEHGPHLHALGIEQSERFKYCACISLQNRTWYGCSGATATRAALKAVQHAASAVHAATNRCATPTRSNADLCRFTCTSMRHPLIVRPA